MNGNVQFICEACYTANPNSIRACKGKVGEEACKFKERLARASALVGVESGAKRCSIEYEPQCNVDAKILKICARFKGVAYEDWKFEMEVV
jgi:hypothetical protein